MSAPDPNPPGSRLAAPAVPVSLPAPPEAVCYAKCGGWLLRLACRPPAPRRVWMLALHLRGRLVASSQRSRFRDAASAVRPVLLGDNWTDEDRDAAACLDRVWEVAGWRGDLALRMIRHMPDDGSRVRIWHWNRAKEDHTLPVWGFRARR